MSTCKKCGCEDKFLTPAPCPDPIGCPEPEPCSELFDAQCVQYNGEDIICGEETIVPTNTNLATALTSIAELACAGVNTSGHYIGEQFGGGVIFHLYKDSLGVEHGLICSIVNQSTGSQYSDITNVAISSTTIWDGQTNTNLMTSQSGASSGAWLYCNNYSYGGFTDWYLPSIDELILLSSNSYNVNKTLSTIGGADQLLTDTYWSSSEIDYGRAWVFYFASNFGNTTDKSDYYNVRAIRQF